MLPSQSDIEIPLLEVLEELGGKGSPEEVSLLVAKKFSQITEADLKEVRRSGTNKWKNINEFVRNTLKNNGELDGSVYGKWQITEKGKKRLRYLFCWNNISRYVEPRLKEFLKKNFGIDWEKTAKIEKSDNDRTIKVINEKNSFLLKLNIEETEVNLEIDDGGTYEFVVEKENNRLNVYRRPLEPPIPPPSEPPNENFPKKEDEQPIDEKTMVEDICKYIKNKGFIFPLDQIINYYLSLKTKPFVILTGISGTGKTKLAEYFADAVVEDREKQFRLIPVRPDWTDDKYLVGYYNPITKEYMSTDFIEFLIDAKLDSENPYFVCLDEMNLARVEYYFSKFLSGLESKDHLINLHDLGNFTLDDEKKDEYIKWQKKQEKKEITEEEFENNRFVISHNGKLIPSKIEIPTNLYFTGTVNMDETTFQFSPKVLDRANTIEILGPSKQEDFFNMNQDKPDNKPDKPGIPERFNAVITKQQNYKWPDELKDKIWKLYKILQKDETHRYDLHFGYRTVNEIGNYIGNSQGLLDQDTAFDLQILQKILPKIKGDESIKDLLEKLKTEIEPYRLSKEKITIIEQRLNDRMYTSFF